MPPESFAPDDPRAWLQAAASDLALAGASVPGVDRLEVYCYHAQQAAEKAVKAVLMSLPVEFPYSHNIGRLLHLAREHGVDVPAEVQRGEALTVYAVTARYPGPPQERVEPAERDEAVAIAGDVLRWAGMLLR